MITEDYIRREIELHLLCGHKLDSITQKVYDATKHYFHEQREGTWFSEDGERVLVVYNEEKTCVFLQNFTKAFYHEFKDDISFTTTDIFTYVIKLGTGVDTTGYKYHLE